MHHANIINVTQATALHSLLHTLKFTYVNTFFQFKKSGGLGDTHIQFLQMLLISLKQD